MCVCLFFVPKLNRNGWINSAQIFREDSFWCRWFLPHFLSWLKTILNIIFQESWQHLLRDRASRTLAYNEEQFHILEKIRMGETIRVIEELLFKVFVYSKLPYSYAFWEFNSIGQCLSYIIVSWKDMKKLLK